MTSTLGVRDELSSSISNYRWGLQVLSIATSAHPYRRIPLARVPRAQRFQASRLGEIDGTFSQKWMPCTLSRRDELSSSRSSYWWGWRETIPGEFYRKPIKPLAAEAMSLEFTCPEQARRDWREFLRPTTWRRRVSSSHTRQRGLLHSETPTPQEPLV